MGVEAGNKKGETRQMNGALARGNRQTCCSLSRSQRKEQQRPRRRLQRIKTKEVCLHAKPSGCMCCIYACRGEYLDVAGTALCIFACVLVSADTDLCCSMASSVVFVPVLLLLQRAAAAPQNASTVSTSPGLSPGLVRAAASPWGPPSAAKRFLGAKTCGGPSPRESFLEGSVVSQSPSSFCCAASVTSEANTARTCGSSSNRGRSGCSAKRARDFHHHVSARGQGVAAVGGRGQDALYPDVHACRPRIFFITLSSVKRQAILKLSLAAAGRGEDPSPCGDDHSTRTSSAKLDTTTSSTAATDKAASPPPQGKCALTGGVEGLELPVACNAMTHADEISSDLSPLPTLHLFVTMQTTVFQRFNAIAAENWQLTAFELQGCRLDAALSWSSLDPWVLLPLST
ncbi:uncharacterized protein LOC34621746 [Cyclospora cayetanensis]|uniref:Uncharacterized protein LOC34621746 n=1 Tax=Cyclospora cayetanensis TaxID=88456 RepID=A0A6P6S138_9EIME|nr:uncharacterized protein LOC34621746 [Cyclospora cayetanensis]